MKQKHADFSPSASERWLNCPASIKMSEGIPEGEPSSYAHEGTICHDIAATCLKKNIPADKFIGEVIEDVRITQELADAIQVYVDEIRGLTKEYNAIGGKIEFEVTIDEDCWGTLDAAIWTSAVLIVVDLKMGKGVIVPVENNTQLMIYAVGVLKWLQLEHALKPQRIILEVNQPRTVDPIRKWEIPREDLIKWYKEVLKPSIKQIKSGEELKCMPGENQCRWCLASATCTAQAEHAVSVAEQAFAPFTEHEKPEMEVAKGDKLSLDGIALLLPSFSHIKDWMKTLEAYALGKALDGTHVPGHKVVEGRSNRVWKVDESVISAFIQSKGFEAYGDPPLLSPAQTEKAMGKKESKAHGLANYIHKPPGAPTLVLEDDKRPAMDIEVDKAFEEFAVDSIVKGIETGIIIDDVIGIASKEIPGGRIIEKDDIQTVITDAPVVIIADEEEEKQFSALDRMMDVDLEDVEPESLGEPSAESLESESDDSEDFSQMFEVEASFEQAARKETATGGSPEVVISAKSSGKAKPPVKAQKRLDVLNMGLGGTSLEDVAKALNTGVNSVKMHLRYINERDGYGYEVYSDNTFKIFE